MILAPVARGRKFDRLRAVDERDQLFPMQLAIDSTATVRPPWSSPPPLDQGEEGSCVGFGSTHALAAAPWRHVLAFDFAHKIYTEAKLRDEWEGEDYEGTSVRAGMKALQDLGLITEYVWAWKTETVRDFVLRRGPVVMGTSWYDQMFDIDGSGYVTPAGWLAGGHCWCVLGYSASRNAFRAINSWGTSWGQNGRFWVRWADFQFLLEQDGGEAVSPLEVAKPGSWLAPS